MNLVLDELQETNKAIKDDFHVIRTTVQTLDKEKDRLCGEIDLKTEENLHLNQEVNAKIRQIEELNMMVAELEAALEYKLCFFLISILIRLNFSRSKDDGKQKLKEITNMRLQFDRNLDESNEYRRKLDLGARDNKRLQEDLLALTRENQVPKTFSSSDPISLYVLRHFIKNLNIPLMIKKISNYKYKNISNKFPIVKMSSHRR